MRMRGQTANAALPKLDERARKVWGLQHVQSNDRAHGIAHGATQERACASFSDDRRLHAKRGTTASEHAHFFSAPPAVPRLLLAATERIEFARCHRLKMFAQGVKVTGNNPCADQTFARVWRTNTAQVVWV